MRTLFTSCLLFCSFSAGYSQISITNADMPVAGDTIRISTTVDQWSIDLTQTGNNFIWDFSYLTPTAQTVDTFFAVTATPFTYQFFFNNQVLYPNHKANYARRGQELDLFGFLTISNAFDFYKNDNGQLKNVGYGANINGIPASVRNIPIDTVYDFPLTAGSTYTSYSENFLNLPNTFYYGQSKTVSNAEVDGWGTITTPLGTFDCVRLAMSIDITDTLNIYFDTLNFGFTVPRPTEVQYHWLAPGMKEPVLQINTSIGGIITSIRYQDNVVFNVGIPETAEPLPLTMYPNPAQDLLLVESFGEKGNIEIYDLSGKLVHQQDIHDGSTLSYVNTSNLAAGSYLVRMNQVHSHSAAKLIITR